MGDVDAKTSPNILDKILKNLKNNFLPKEIIVGAKNSDDAAVYTLDKKTSLILTTDFFVPIVDNPNIFKVQSNCGYKCHLRYICHGW